MKKTRNLRRSDLPPDFVKKLNSIKSKRPRTIIQHLLQHGAITTEEISKQYGYSHPPRAIRDVKDKGIHIDSFKVRDSNGRQISAYRFASPTKTKIQSGRHAYPKDFKKQLIKRDNSCCAICTSKFSNNELQIDHRVPFQIAGSKSQLDSADFMLLCNSCNRRKSWSCEHCKNFTIKSIDNCLNCQWANPHVYTHVAMKLVRTIPLTWWDQDEIDDYDQIQQLAKASNKNLPTYIKDILKKTLDDD